MITDTNKNWGQALEKAIQKKIVQSCIRQMIQVLEQTNIQNINDAFCVEATIEMLEKCSDLQDAKEIYKKASEMMSNPLPKIKEQEHEQENI
jgi:hypothetical protein